MRLPSFRFSPFLLAAVLGGGGGADFVAAQTGAAAARDSAPALVSASAGTEKTEQAGQRLEVTRDVWISAFPSEQDGNNGGSAKLKAKGIQELFLMDAEFARLKPETVRKAVLHVHLESPDAPLRRVTAGTVAVPWTEGRGSGYEKDTGGASFRSPGTGRWAGGPDITAAILGQAGTRWAFAEAGAPDADGWQAIPVDPAVIRDCAAGISHGVVVVDDVGSEYTRDGDRIRWRLFPNRFVSSREGPKARAPWFEVWTEEGGTSAPPASGREALPAAAGDGASPPAPGAVSGKSAVPAASAAPGPVSASALPAAGLPENGAEAPAGKGGDGGNRPPAALPDGWRAEDLFGERLESLTLSSARNEAVCLRLRVPGGACEIVFPAPFEVSLRRIAEVEGAPDPLPGLSAPDTGALLLEIQTPKDAPAGRITGRVTAGGVTAPLELTVWNFTLPDRLSFVPEMNAYGLPDQSRELDWHRLAHRHRTCLNVLRYNWRGRVHDGCAPRSLPDGSWDWEAWDRRFGPLLDGSAFAGLPREGTPAESFYLPLNENWPMEIEKHFRGGYWADTAFDGAYWEEFGEAARRFAAHIRDRKWDRTLFEFYLNNKVYFKAERGSWSACSAPWIFDEPVNTQDFFALREFGRRFNAAARPLAANAVFRCDISRPEWQRDLLDGVTGVEVLGGAMRDHADRTAARQERWGQMTLLYGAAAAPGDVLQPAAWSLEAWCLGRTGCCPGRPSARRSHGGKRIRWPFFIRRRRARRRRCG